MTTRHYKAFLTDIETSSPNVQRHSRVGGTIWACNRDDRRFVLDSDVEDNVRCVRKHVERGLVVGMILLSDPDFEFGCFTVEQLIEATALVERGHGQPELRRLDAQVFAETRSAREFEQAYCSARTARGLKGEAWGKALAQIAFASCTASDDESNPFVHMVNSAIRPVSLKPPDKNSTRTRQPSGRAGTKG